MSPCKALLQGVLGERKEKQKMGNKRRERKNT
jgi:hypothetical protein